MILINGQPDDRISVSDRGLQYGDGLFETIAFRNGQPEYLTSHLQRLYQGCSRLNIPLTDTVQSALNDDIQLVCKQLNKDAVIKIIVTRGAGGRGYRYQQETPITRILSTHDMPVYPVDYYEDGVVIRICQQKLAVNPSLAGLKHLNRLEQILARNEWQKENIVEGLMFDYDGNLIEGTMSNVFLIKNNQLLTAKLNHAGVAGIMRQQIIDRANQLNLPVQIKPLTMNDLHNADEVFICNSLIGLWPVKQIVDTDLTFKVGPVTNRLQQSVMNRI